MDLLVASLIHPDIGLEPLPMTNIRYRVQEIYYERFTVIPLDAIQQGEMMV